MICGPITVRGTEYPDEAAVAAAFGISPKAVRNAVNRGRQDYIGIPAHLTRIRTGQEPMTVRVRGTIYPSAKAAAEALGVTVVTVLTAIRAGREDYIGLGKSRTHSTGNVGKVPGNAKPVKVGSYQWTSIRQCAMAFGVGRTTICGHLRAGNHEWIIARAMAAEARREGHKARLPDTADRDAKRAHSTAMLAAWRKRKAEGQIKKRMTA